MDALASGSEKGRGKLRKAPVSRKQAFDPEISDGATRPRVIEVAAV